MEVAQLANEGAFIGGTAAVTFAIVLVVSLAGPGGMRQIIWEHSSASLSILALTRESGNGA